MFIFLFFIISLPFFIFQIFFKFSKKSIHESKTTPPSHPFIGCLLAFSENRHRLIHWYTDLLSKSPSQTILIKRLGARRTIVTANSENVEYMLKTNFNNFPKGKPFTDLLGDLLGFGIFNVDGELWSMQRKLASHEFSTKSIREFSVKILQEEVEERLIPLMEEAAVTGNSIDLQEVLRRFAFDVICKFSLGNDPCCLDVTKPVPPLFEAFERASVISAMRSTESIQSVWKLKRAFNVGNEKKLKEAVKIVHESVLEIVKEKKEMINGKNGIEKDDLLSRFLSTGHGEEVVRDMVVSFIMAGRDTTSAAMTWLFWLLSTNRNAEETIVNEVKSQPLDYESMKEMNFTKACLNEAMRLYPPVVWDSKHALNDDVLPDGTFVRKGDRVTYFPYGMGRMENIWGEDRFEFKPDRWFSEPWNGKSSEPLKTVSPYKFPVFQAGPRVCLGKEMAFMQMKYVVASVLKRFELVPVSLNRPVFVPLLTGHMVGGFKVLIKKRTFMSSKS